MTGIFGGYEGLKRLNTGADRCHIAPLIGAAIISAAGSALGGYGANKAQEASEKRRVALEESMANPFRHQLAQAGSMQSLDFMERASYTKPTLSGRTTQVGRIAVPEVAGGFSYQRSPELISGAARLKQDVASGRHAPTMTDEKNFGKTAALDLTRPDTGMKRSLFGRMRKRRPGEGPSYL